MAANYVNFDLRLSKESNGDYLSEALDENGDVKAGHKFDFATGSLAFVTKLRELEKSAENGLDEKELVKFGKELYAKALGGDAGVYFAECLKGNGQVRILLHISEDAPELMQIPWEMLHDGKSFLSTGLDTPLVRLPVGLEPKTTEPVKGKLQMLVIVSSPLDLDESEKLQIDYELEKILQSLDRLIAADKIEVDFEDEASLENIQDRLDEKEYHIVHYTGHGVHAGRGYLLLEGDDGKKKMVDNDTIATLLSGYPSIRLVFLSGCQTAKVSTHDAFSGLSRPLLREGIPSVVAMQYSVIDETAIKLEEKFYTCVGQGDPVDVAITKAKKEIYLSGRKSEFATPVLFTMDPDCLKFEAGTERPPGLAGAVVPAPDPSVYINLEQLGARFIGRRSELRRIKKGFIGGVRALVLHGIGGIGKTVMATQIALRLQKGKWVQGVYAFDCKGGGLNAEKILTDLNQFFLSNGIEALAPVLQSPAPLDFKMNQLGQILAQLRLLLIFDNFEDLLDEENKNEITDPELKKAIKILVNTVGNSTKLLFTTRYDFNLMDGRASQLLDSINLGELSRPEAVMHMNRFHDLAKEDFSTKLEIYKRIGGHPYTINIFGGHCRARSAQEVLADLSGIKKEMVEFTLLEMTYSKLSEEAKTLLNRASVFLKPVPVEGLEWSVKAAGAGDVLPLLQELIHWSLLVRIEKKDETYYQVHAVVRDFIVEKTSLADRKKWQIDAGEFYEQRAKETKSIWDYLEARELYFAAGEYEKAGSIVTATYEYIVRWGYMDLAKSLLAQSYETVREESKTVHLGNLAQIYYLQGDYGEAKSIYETVLKIFKGLGDQRNVAAVLHLLGIVHQRQGGYPAAVEKYELCLKTFEALGTKVEMAAVLHQLGMVHHEQGDYPAAMEKYKRSLEMKEELGSTSGIAQTLHQLGIVHQEQGDYPAAVEKYERSLEIAEELRDKSGIASTLHQLGIVHQQQGDYPAAVEKYERSLEIAEELRDKSGIAQTLHQLGVIHQNQGDYPAAVEKYERSLEMKEEMGDRSGIALTQWAIAIIHKDLGKYSDAVELYEACLDTFKGLGDLKNQAGVLHQLGIVHQDQGDYPAAVEKYERSLEIAEELGNKSGIATTLGQLGKLHHELKEYEKALEHYAIALSIFEILCSPNAEIVKGHLAELREDMGTDEFDKAWKELEKKHGSE